MTKFFNYSTDHYIIACDFLHSIGKLAEAIPEKWNVDGVKVIDFANEEIKMHQELHAKYNSILHDKVGSITDAQRAGMNKQDALSLFAHTVLRPK